MNEEVVRLVRESVGTLFTACVIGVERHGAREVFAAGTICPDPSAGPDAPCTPDSVFDIASVTKLSTTALALSFVRERVITLDTPFRDLVSDFRGGRKDDVTLAHVMTHTAGLSWWAPLWKEARSAEEAVWLAAKVPLAQDIGVVRYSDLGYLMLTEGLAHVGGAPFAELARERVAEPIEAATLRYLPDDPQACVATEEDTGWRKRRLRGEVHDENAFSMGGVSGHAGLFGTVADVLALARVYRDGAVIGNELAALARREHARGDNERRGLGLALRAPTGGYLSEDSYGHTGYTGMALWVDPRRDLTVATCTNRVYFGRGNADDIYRFRKAVHDALAAEDA